MPHFMCTIAVSPYDTSQGHKRYPQAQAALSTQLVEARQQHAEVCAQLQKEQAAAQQAALQEHSLQKVTPPLPLPWLGLCLLLYPCFISPFPSNSRPMSLQHCCFIALMIINRLLLCVDLCTAGK